MFILFYLQIFAKLHTNRWLILKVLPHVVNVSLSRWTPGFSANIVPLPYGHEICDRKHYVQFYISTKRMLD